jgi:hypothetical protein
VQENELQNSTRHYLTLIAQYEEEKIKQNKSKGLTRVKGRNSVLESFSFKKKLSKNKNTVI